MRRKRTLPSAHVAQNNPSSSVNDANGRQIHRLEDDPSLQTLTPRSLAKSMAELDALRCRVQELEQQLAQHQLEAMTPSKASKKLPPLADTSGLTVSPHAPITLYPRSVY